MNIRFLKSPSGAPYLMAYFPGDIADIEDAVARDLIQQGVAEPVKQASKPSDASEKADSKQASKAEKR